MHTHATWSPKEQEHSPDDADEVLRIWTPTSQPTAHIPALGGCGGTVVAVSLPRHALHRELDPARLQQVDFIWSVCQPQRACAGVGVGQPRVLAHALPAVDLDGAVRHVACHPRASHLDQGNHLACRLVTLRVHQVRGAKYQKASLENGGEVGEEPGGGRG
eukprot:scaffold32939_cov96-Isochrysis_galbana.AAC.1